MPKYPIYDTIGIEYETEYVRNDKLSGLPNEFSPVHDASIESDVVELFNGITVRNIGGIRNKLRVNGKVIGTELVSNPINIEARDMLDTLKKLTSFLMSKGEPSESYRASIHIHVCSPFNLKILKNIIILGAHLEDVFYRIGCQGYEFRGMVVNESQYCRPITKFGPQIVPYSESFGAQLYTIKDLLESKRSVEFWDRYGNTDQENIKRYVPVRYSWLNLYSLLYHGSLEFRPFNKTMNPHFINAQVHLCRKFTQFAVSGNVDELQENSVYNERDTEDLVKTLRDFADMSGLSEYSAEILETIIRKSPQVSLPKRYVWAHIRTEGRLWQRSKYEPRLIPSSTVKIVKVEDIHNLRRRVR